MFGRTMYLLATQKPGAAHTFAICRPNTGASYFDMEVSVLQPLRRALFLVLCSAGPGLRFLRFTSQAYNQTCYRRRVHPCHCQ
jgi:hypothetical protein